MSDASHNSSTSTSNSKGSQAALEAPAPGEQQPKDWTDDQWIAFAEAESKRVGTMKPEDSPYGTYVFRGIIFDVIANSLVGLGAIEGCSSDVAHAVLREYLDPVDEETEDKADAAKQATTKRGTESKDS